MPRAAGFPDVHGRAVAGGHEPRYGVAGVDEVGGGKADPSGARTIPHIALTWAYEPGRVSVGAAA
jgi:hypothetical protein